MREQRKALRLRMRETLPALRAQARERVQKLRAMRKRPPNKWKRRSPLLLLLLLLLLLIKCEPAEQGAIAAARSPLPPASAKPTPLNLDASLQHKRRPGFQGDGHPAPDWLDDFRLQVAARSPRLAQCFNGADKSGMFRWTVSVDAASGTVTDHQLEPIREGADLGRDQRQCVTAALSNPGYKLKPRAKQAMPDRVSLIIEF